MWLITKHEHKDLSAVKLSPYEISGVVYVRAMVVEKYQSADQKVDVFKDLQYKNSEQGSVRERTKKNRNAGKQSVRLKGTRPLRTTSRIFA